tara:strand:- start:48 stop:389 length:342 start_codon:yes stop_codon:yes gene_type:complete
LRDLLIGILFYFIGQLMVWFQTNSQFIWPWAKKNPLLIAMVFGGVTTYFFILGTKYVQSYFGVLWPGRFIGFSIGVLIFALLTWLFLDEGVNLKTAVSLLLAVCLILVQLFWK